MPDPTLKTPVTSGGHKEDDVIERRTLRDYYIILRERLWIALPLALIVSVGYGYLQARRTPLFASVATMQFEKPEVVVTSVNVVDPAIRSEIELNTHLTTLNSQMLRKKVAASFSPDELKVLQRPYLKNAAAGTAPTDAIALLGRVSSELLRNTFLISISVRHEDPDAAALVANRFVQTFMGHIRQNTFGSSENAVDFLTQRAEILRKDSEEAEQKLQAYKKAKNLVSLDRNKDIVTTALNAASAALTAARFDRIRIETQVSQVQAYQKANRDLAEIDYITNHGNLARIRAELAQARQLQSIKAEKYLERHPLMIDLANQISVLEDQLGKAINLAVADLNTRLAQARQTESNFAAEVEAAQKKSLELGELGVEYASLENDAIAKRKNYNEILDRRNSAANLKEVNLEKIPLRTLDEATPNRIPFDPDMKAVVRTCIGIGVIVFIGVSVGLSFIDDRIKSAWDVEAFIGANLLGIIPDLSTMKDEDKYTLLLQNKQAPGVEAFLSVYSSVKIHSKLDFPKSILVTSTIPGEGKTLISCNLAGSFARHSKRTLLIDCDLRRPMLHRHFKQQNNAGLITWFEGGAPLEGELATNAILGIIKISDTLSLLASGGRSKSPTEILENPVFGQLIERLKREYDLVIIDSPPLGAVTDSLLIAERADEVIYVCRFNRAFRKHIRLYIKALRNGKNEILGVVLNGLSPRRIEYYSNYRYYRSYKKYYGAQS